MFRFGRNVVIGTRFFSTQSHAPPKKIHGTVGRYAGAVYTSASKAGLLNLVETELKVFNDAVKKSPAFAAFLANPTIPRGEKTMKVADIIGEDKFSHITRNLFVTMSANGRIGDAPKVVEAYLDLMETSRGVVKVVITAAEQLTKKSLDGLKVAIATLAGPGKQVDLVVKVDPAILGGLQVLV
eukprot:gene14498-30865_t